MKNCYIKWNKRNCSEISIVHYLAKIIDSWVPTGFGIWHVWKTGALRTNDILWLAVSVGNLTKA